MIICLDGIDGAGKSTLANDIVAKLRVQFPQDTVHLLHASQPKSDVFTEYFSVFEDYDPSGSVHYVLDRWFLGEQIYGQLYRGKSSFTTSTFRWMDLALATIGFRLWNITAPLDIIKTRLEQRGEDFLQSEHVEFVRSEYLKLVPTLSSFAKSVVPKKNDQELVEVIIKDAIYAASMATIFADSPVTYMGPTFVMPRTVLVVDNTKENIGFNPTFSQNIDNVLSALTVDMANSFGFVSALSTERLDEFLSEYAPFANVVAYSEYVKNKLKYIGRDFGDLTIPVPTLQYGITLKNKAEESGKIHA